MANCLICEYLCMYVYKCVCSCIQWCAKYVCVCSVVPNSLRPTRWATQALLSTEFLRQVYWNGLPFPTLGDLSDPGIEPASVVSLALAGRFFTSAPPGVQFSSVAQSCLTFCNPMDCSRPGFPVHHQLPELAQTHVHQVRWTSRDVIQLFHPLTVPFSSCLQSLPASAFFPMSQFFTSGGKVLHFQLPHQSFQWTFRTDFL